MAAFPEVRSRGCKLPAHRFDLLARFTSSLLIVAAVMITSSCGGGQSTPPPPVEHVSVTVNPSSATVPAGQSQQVTATVTGSTNQSVSWSVNGVNGGNATMGTVSPTGLYTAPSVVPSPNTVSVTATSNADTTKSASAQVTITQQISVSISPTSASVQTQYSQQFTAAVTGSSNQSVTWSADGAPGGNSFVGTISPTGLYTAPFDPSPPTFKVRATSVADPSKYAEAQVTVVFPPVVDFSALPSQLETNLRTFLVSGSTNPADQVSVNGANVTLNSLGDFAYLVPLAIGPNRIELDIQSSQKGLQPFIKMVTVDPAYSTAGLRLLYVSSIAQTLPGTIVIDIDHDILLGVIDGKRVRGISPDGSLLYMDDLSVINTATHQDVGAPLSPLAFSKAIPSNGFLVSPDGTRLYSRDEALDATTNTLLPKLPVSIETGRSYAGPNQGGPAISPDGRKIFWGPDLQYPYYDVGVIDTVTNSVSDTGIVISGAWLSDIATSPDGRLLVVTSYFGGGAEFYDATTYAKLGSSGWLGDFAGQIVFTKDSKQAFAGIAGNPANRGGSLTALDTSTYAISTHTVLDLADHLVLSDTQEVYVSTGSTPNTFVYSQQADGRAPGVDVYVQQVDGTLRCSKRYGLGINRFVYSSGDPKNDEIEKIVFKP